MVRVYVFTGQHTISWPTALLIVYAILALISAVFALILAYHGDKLFKNVPERCRNRPWMKPLLPIIFIILPALLWPIVMVGVGIISFWGFLANKQDGIGKKMKDGQREKDVEMGLGTDARPNEQSATERNTAITTNLADANTITEPPPAYISHESSRRLLLEG